MSVFPVSQINVLLMSEQKLSVLEAFHLSSQLNILTHAEAHVAKRIYVIHSECTQAGLSKYGFLAVFSSAPHHAYGSTVL